MSLSRVAFYSLLIAFVTVVAISVGNNWSHPANSVPPAPLLCAPPTDHIRISGPPMTAEQVEMKELGEDKRLGIKSSVPFGDSDPEWSEFKKKAGKQDHFYAYTDISSGGYAVVRGNCVLDTFMTWIS